MNKYLFDRLAFYNSKIPGNCEEFVFYNENVMLFNQETNKYANTYSLTSIIDADVVLRSLYNKNIIDAYINDFDTKYIKQDYFRNNVFSKLISFKYEGVDIYIPLYDVEVNKLYFNNLASLKNENEIYLKNTNYNLVNPFETYKNAIYDSNFTRLIKLESENDTYSFYYHLEFETIFIVNKNNGLIENEIPLYDLYLKKLDKKDLFKRLNYVINVFLKDDEKIFMRELLENNFISNAFYREVMKDLLKKI